MDRQEELAGRVRDLSARAWENEYVTHTRFLTVDEMSYCLSLLGNAAAASSRTLAFGGYGEAERRVLYFVPSWQTPEELREQESAGNGEMTCIRIRPLNAKFSDLPQHRDYLGALMSLGIERDLTGDILMGDGETFVYALQPAASYLCENLTSVRHTFVKCDLVPPGACTAMPHFREIGGTVASLRIDAVIALVFHLSRTKTKELVESGCVYADGREVTNAGLELKEGMRVSVRGHGKIIYEGTEGVTKKDRLYIRIRVYD